jgi:ATP-dependent DNA helicase PIF1
MYICYHKKKNSIIEFENYIELMNYINLYKNDIIFLEISNQQEKDIFIQKNLQKMSELTQEQNKIITLVNEKKNIFITGVPGSGKSFVLSYIVNSLDIKSIKYGLTATTGTAAVNIGGQTLHSFFGLTPFVKDYKEHVLSLRTKRKDVLYRLFKLETLIIEEVSMLDNIIFEGLSDILKIVKDNNKPFGGIQLILVGDFFQLKPIENDYCFLSSLWNKINMETVILTKMIRQDGDEEFKQILKEIRTGNISDITYKKLKNLKNTIFESNIIPTKLYPKNKEVDKINIENINKLKEPFKIYKATFSGLKEIPEYNISLCIGAQIMVTRNISIDLKIVNGTRGIILKLLPKTIIISLVNGTEYEVEYTTDYINKEKTKNIYFLPIKIAYAISIHKSQGATLDCLEVDLGSNIFSEGQSYVALSRARNLKDIKVIDISRNSFKIDQRVLDKFG